MCGSGRLRATPQTHMRVMPPTLMDVFLVIVGSGYGATF
jgi:hypothetical protein